MKIEVKLYSYHDMDLVSLYKSGRVVFPETTRQILNAYANKEAYKVRLLKPNQKKEKKYPSDTYKKYYHYHVTLDDEIDAKAIALLEGITPGCRNNFIKVLLRQYICCEIPSGYSITGDTRLFRSMTKLFQGDLDEKEIRQTRRGKINTKKPKAEKKRKNSQIQTEEEIKDTLQSPPEEDDKNTNDIEPYSSDNDDGFDIDDFLSGAAEQY